MTLKKIIPFIHLYQTRKINYIYSIDTQKSSSFLKWASKCWGCMPLPHCTKAWGQRCSSRKKFTELKLNFYQSADVQHTTLTLEGGLQRRPLQSSVAQEDRTIKSQYAQKNCWNDYNISHWLGWAFSLKLSLPPHRGQMFNREAVMSWASYWYIWYFNEYAVDVVFFGTFPSCLNVGKLGLQEAVPAIMLSVVEMRWSTCWIRPTSVHACRLRTLFLRMAVKMLHISAWQVGSHLSNSSTRHTMLSGSWMMKFISRSNWPPTSWRACAKKKKVHG